MPFNLIRTAKCQTVIKLTRNNKQLLVLTLELSKEQPPNKNAIFPAIVSACPCLKRNMEQW